MDIGIIGGADGPTKIYVTTGVNWYAVAATVLVVFAVTAIAIWAVKKCIRKK